MTRGFSLYLDLVRVIAAGLVLFSHVAFAWASGGSLQWVRDLNIGSDAVIVFFVLSGFVIAYAAQEKDRTLARFATARLTRLYSVAAPAIVLSYFTWWLTTQYPGAASAERDVVGEVLRALTFTNYLWFGETRLPGNGPYWSVAYEFWYYALFGAWTFLSGRTRWFVLGAIVLFVGPPMLLLLPSWLLGVRVWRAVARGDHAAPSARPLLWIGGPIAAYAAFQAVNLPTILHVGTYFALGEQTPYDVLHFADEFVWNTIVAVLVATHFRGVAAVMRDGALERAAGVIRWWAGRTFSLYLFHMPVLKLIAAHPAYDVGDPVHIVYASVLTVTVCLVLAELTERRLAMWRRLGEQLVAGFAAVSNARPRPA